METSTETILGNRSSCGSFPGAPCPGGVQVLKWQLPWPFLGPISAAFNYCQQQLWHGMEICNMRPWQSYHCSVLNPQTITFLQVPMLFLPILSINLEIHQPSVVSRSPPWSKRRLWFRTRPAEASPFALPQPGKLKKGRLMSLAGKRNVSESTVLEFLRFDLGSGCVVMGWSEGTSKIVPRNRTRERTSWASNVRTQGLVSSYRWNEEIHVNTVHGRSVTGCHGAIARHLTAEMQNKLQNRSIGFINKQWCWMF